MAFAWYTLEQWTLLKEYAADGNALDETYEKWQRHASHAFSELKRSGVPVQKVQIDIEQLRVWCRENGRPLDQAARSQYAVEMLQRLYQDPP